MEEQITDIQARLMFQEESLDSLNRTIAMQEQLIMRLIRDVEELQEQVRELSPSPLEGMGPEPPPPHY
ncbi:MAG: SlyX family protein [bacterium]